MNMDWLRRPVLARGRAKREFTAQSVRRWMREDADSEQAARVRGQVERLNLYLHEPRLRARYKGLESYYTRMPAILSMHARGRSLEEIAEYYRPVLTSYGVDRSLDILSEHIARRLNEGR